VEPLTWWQSGVIYQIYPRSFADANGDGDGDLRGILDHLDYLNDGTDDSLGVAAIWLSPFYRSPMADFGYDISDYTDVDPVFGTLADFDDLLAGVHRRGVKLIVDWVPNHTSDQHPWFVESARSLDNAKRDWYVWRDPAPDGGPPNNWRSAFPAVGSAWTFDKTTAQYYLHSFTPHQPHLNWDNPEVEAAMHDVLRFWLDRGVDGFRIDVIYKIAKDPELRDNEPGLQHDEDWPTIHDRLRRIRAVIEKYDDRMIVGEVYLLDLKKLVEYINTGDELHLAHNFVFFHLPWQAAAYRASVQEFTELAEVSAWPAWFGMNWSNYSVFVGNIFGAPLAMEGLLAFFAESTFIGLWLFGRNRLPALVHTLSICVVSLATIVSAFFILAANAWMQHPVGYRIVGNKAELADFWAVLRNSTLWAEFSHTVLAAFVTGAMVVLGVSGWQLLRGGNAVAFTRSARLAAWVALVGTVAVMVTGDIQARLMDSQQPMKMAAAEAVYRTQSGASFSLLTIGNLSGQPIFQIRIPHLLSLIATLSWNGRVDGITSVQHAEALRYGPGSYVPVLWVTYWSFRLMVGSASSC